MTTKRVQHHTQKFQWNNYHNPYLPIRGGGEGAETGNEISFKNQIDPQRSAKQSRRSGVMDFTCKPLQTRGPPCTSLAACGSTADPLVMSRGQSSIGDKIS